MVADPLDALAAALAGEDVEADLRPVVDALRDLDGLVLGVIGGLHAVDDVALAVGGEVGVELDHGGAGSDRVGAIDLDLVVALGAQRRGWLRRAEKTTAGKKTFQCALL